MNYYNCKPLDKKTMITTREAIIMLADNEERAAISAAKFWNLQVVDSGDYYDSSAGKIVIVHVYKEC